MSATEYKCPKCKQKLTKLSKKSPNDPTWKCGYCGSYVPNPVVTTGGSDGTFTSAGMSGDSNTSEN